MGLCPKCDGDIGQLDVIEGVAWVMDVEGDGKVIFSDETDVDWDSQRAKDHPRQFICRGCTALFHLIGGKFVEIRDPWKIFVREVSIAVYELPADQAATIKEAAIAVRRGQGEYTGISEHSHNLSVETWSGTGPDGEYYEEVDG